jgi:hypothetical protein
MKTILLVSAVLFLGSGMAAEAGPNAATRCAISYRQTHQLQCAIPHKCTGQEISDHETQGAHDAARACGIRPM